MKPLPRLAAALLRFGVPKHWADSVIGDLEDEWRALPAPRWRDTAALTLEAARVATRFGAERARLSLFAAGRDLRAAARMLGRRPRFAAAALAVLGLGSAAQLAAFAVVERVLLRPLPYADPDRLIEVSAEDRLTRETSRAVSSTDFASWREGLADVAQLAAYELGRTSVRLAGSDDARPAAVARVSPDLFEVLGVGMARGRSFTPDEGRVGAPGPAILSDETWRARFGGDPAVVGANLVVDGQTHPIVGVAPPGAEFPPGVGIWIARDPVGVALRGLRIEFASLRVVARLRGTGDPEAALARIARRGESLAAEAGRPQAPRAERLLDAIVGPVRDTLRLGWLAVALLCLVAWANASGLLLLRTLARTDELLVRQALGASPLALGRQVLAEALLLAAGGSALGLGLAALGLYGFAWAEHAAVPRLSGVAISPLAGALAAASTLVAAVGVGTLPALAAARRRAHGRDVRVTARSAPFAAPLVALQLTVTAVLLVAAATTGWGVLRLAWRDPGFDPAEVAVATLQPDPRQARAASGASLYDPLLQRLSALPGVEAVAMADHVPPEVVGLEAPVALEGTAVGGESAPVQLVSVTARYFVALGLPLVEGRAFTEEEVRHGAPVAIVDELFAGRAGGASVLGRRAVLSGRVLEVVGVARAARQGPPELEPQPTLYRPLGSGAFVSGAATFVSQLFVLVRGGGAEALPAQRAALAAARVGEPGFVAPLEVRLADALGARRFQAGLFAAFALVGAALTIFGLYAQVSFVVEAAAREIGVRLAVGASRGQVVVRVLRRALGPAAVGAAIGLALAPGLSALLARRLPGLVEPGTWLTVAVAVALLAVVAAASVIPARRAAGVDPVRTLRCE
ncbi:MAG: ABC transporter permease [Vicinamibacteria bacterium]|nr:ABC transporter permease [Vicinamibacteria bacterium]